MQTYACLVRRVGDSSWDWGGFASGITPLDAAAALAVSVEGYTKEADSDGWRLDLVEQFIDDGWRFKLIEVKTDSSSIPATYNNDEIG